MTSWQHIFWPALVPHLLGIGFQAWALGISACWSVVSHMLRVTHQWLVTWYHHDGKGDPPSKFATWQLFASQATPPMIASSFATLSGDKKNSLNARDQCSTAFFSESSLIWLVDQP